MIAADTYMKRARGMRLRDAASMGDDQDSCGRVVQKRPYAHVHGDVTGSLVTIARMRAAERKRAAALRERSAIRRTTPAPVPEASPSPTRPPQTYGSRGDVIAWLDGELRWEYASGVRGGDPLAHMRGIIHTCRTQPGVPIMLGGRKVSLCFLEAVYEELLGGLGAHTP